MSKIYVTSIDEAERMIAEMHESVHASGPMHCELGRAVRNAFAGDICNDVFLNIAARDQSTFEGLLSLWEIKHVVV